MINSIMGNFWKLKNGAVLTPFSADLTSFVLRKKFSVPLGDEF